MNDPNSIDSAYEAMLESLEAEYMALAKNGDRSAFDFALEYSDHFNCVAQDVMMRLMEQAPPEGAVFDLDTVIKIASVAMVARERLEEAFSAHVAPQWAQTEYSRRQAENLEMQQDWKEDLLDESRYE